MLKPIILAMAVMIFVWPPTESPAKVYQTISRTYQTTDNPLDVSTSEDGQHTFVLTKGKILIYGQNGLTEEISVDPSFDHISAAITSDKIFLSSNKEKKVQEILLDFVKHININGSPFLGAEDAKVTVVVFSDFQ